MKGFLKPRYTQSVNDLMVLWFEPSNQYTIVDNGLFFCLQTYFDTDTEKQCVSLYKKQFQLSSVQAEQLLNDVEKFLTDRNSNIIEESIAQLDHPIEKPNYVLTKYYSSSKKIFCINYESEDLLTYIHPQLAHLETTKYSKTDFYFNLSIKNNLHLLYKNDVFVRAFPTNHYHKLQGRIYMELINALHNKVNHDWIGVFHASTVSNNRDSVMLIGQSGSGKSTFTTLLTCSGYSLIADDNTPLLNTDFNVYHLPNAISTKEGAFNTLRAYIPNIDELENNHLRAYKGAIKYIPALTPDKLQVPCKTLVLINYQKDAATELKRINAKKALEILIPDSWISPKPENAKAFLEWLTTLSFYKLTYSNNEDAILKFRSILPI
ncbi:hypothetical protein [Formosa sp. A9]|uniref:hypothetical protein n=1 Tax=Formosa sp. A9 TaxID=3442641 RepID=UPI003EBB84EC